MARKPKKERLDEQRERQEAYRMEQKKRKRPSRDDIARIVLHQVIVGAIAKGRTDALDRIRDDVVGLLEQQGFDARESDIVFENLTEKYARGNWGFRRKIHLIDQPSWEEYVASGSWDGGGGKGSRQGSGSARSEGEPAVRSRDRDRSED